VCASPEVALAKHLVRRICLDLTKDIDRVLFMFNLK